MTPMIRILSKRKPAAQQLQNASDFTIIDCTSHGVKELSPLHLGPISCYDGMTARKMENAWQFAKVYAHMADANQQPTEEYFRWRNQGFSSNWAQRYPMGKGAKPLYSCWKTPDGQELHLSYIEARKQIYIPLYSEAVRNTKAFQTINDLYQRSHNLALLDFDGWDNEAYGIPLSEVVNQPQFKMGHAFVIAMMLQGII